MDTKTQNLTKAEFLARCAMIYDLGFTSPEILTSLERGANVLSRLADSAAANDLLITSLRHPADIGFKARQQEKRIAFQGVELEAARLRATAQSNGALRPGTLASDPIGWNAVQLAAILRHPCQQCATDPHGFWTRAGFCPHRANGEESNGR